MDFVDEVTIHVVSGRGGDGSVSFRREKYVPHGGPNGGDGGYGSDVVLEADKSLSTLIEMRYKSHYVGSNGGAGGGNNKSGSHMPPLIIKVPVGTTAYELSTKRTLADLTYHGQSEIIAKGGRGGRGNASFASSTNQAPKFGEKGEPSEDLDVRLELRLLADAGVIGFPSVGKSTLIASVSNARPKIADYPFTTLTPNLGVVRVSPTESFVMADVPGLIEGAHTGAGLGHRFLRHIERTRVLIHMIDCSPLTGRDPLEDYGVIINELIQYNPVLADLPEIIVLNKVDIPEAKEKAGLLLQELPERYPRIAEKSQTVRMISTATGEGMQRLVWDIARMLREMPKISTAAAVEDIVRIEGPQTPFVIKRSSTGEFVITGKQPERMVAMTDLENPQALRRLQHRLETLGVFKELRRLGIKDEDAVRVRDFEFDWYDEGADDAQQQAEMAGDTE